jgi:hypothetical protein
MPGIGSHGSASIARAVVALASAGPPLTVVDFRRTSPHQRWCSLECHQRGKRRVVTALDQRVALPRVQPIAPVRRAEPFDDPEWVFDLKYDGFRALCYLEQGRCHLISRNGNPMHRFAGLADRIAAALDVGDAILDGEVIASGTRGRPPMSRSICSGSTALICGRWRSASAGSTCRASCPRGRRSFPSRCRSWARGASSSS